MGVGGTMILGGLLQGLGAGVTKVADERRQNALLALKRQYDVEDREANAATILDKERLEGENRLKVIDATGAQNRETQLLKNEGDLKVEEKRGSNAVALEGVKFTNDKSLARLNNELSISKDKAAQALSAELDQGKVKSVEAAEDGTMLVVYNNGTTVKKNIKLRDTKSGDSDGDEGSISAAVAERNGTAAKPAQATNTPKKDDATRNRAYNALARSWATATPQTHPSFFINGKKRSKAELQAEIDKLTGF